MLETQRGLVSFSSRDEGEQFFFFFLFRAAHMAYGSSQARGRIGAAAASLCHSIEPTSSWILVEFTSAKSQRELQAEDC